MSRYFPQFVVAVCLAAGLALPGLCPSVSQAQSYRELVGKACAQCSKSVNMTSRVGGACPHCGSYWGARCDRVAGTFPIPAFPTRTRSSGVSVKAKTGLRFQGTPTPLRMDTDSGVRSPAGRYLARGTGDGFVAIYNAGGHYRFRLPHAGRVSAQMFSADDDAIVCVDGGGRCALYQLPEGIRIHRLTSRGVRGAIFLPNGSNTVVLANHRAVWFKSGRNEPVMGRITTLADFIEVVVHCEGRRTVLNTVDSKGRTAVFDGGTGQRLVASSY